MKHLPAPATRKTDFAEDLHDIRVEDPYRWLEDTETPEAQAWIKTQATYANEYLSKLPGREILREEFAHLFSIETISIPQVRKGRYFFMKRKPGQEMGIYYVKEGLNGEPRILIDPATLSDDGSTTLKTCRASRDGKLLLYEISHAGNDRNEIRVLSVDTGKALPDVIAEDCYPYIAAWNSDGTGFWYVRRDPEAPTTQEEEKFHCRVFFHTLGTDVTDDQLIFGKGLARESMPYVSLAEDGRYLLGQVSGQTEGKQWNEIAIMDTQTPEKGFVIFAPAVPDIRCVASLHRDHVYMQTNDNAPRWKLVSTSITDALSGKPLWSEVIPASDNTLEDFAPVGDHLFATFLVDAHSAFREYTLGGTPVRDIPLPVMGSVAGLNFEREGTELFFWFNSFAFPPTVYRIDLTTGETRLYEQMEAGYDTEQLETSQRWFTSKDGTRIPLFLIHKKGLALDGCNPSVLYGYGGFDVSLTPNFLRGGIPFILRGGVYAIVNLRGGGEFGKEWHEAGMKKNKKNVFDDFAAAARWLVSEKYTRPEKLAVSGGSNGGLLTCVTAIQHPELIKAVISAVPVTDMLRYHRFTGGRHWIPDYGDPDDADMIPYLLSYSPYHNATGKRKYPSILITTSSDDDRVHPMHSFKMAARFQETNCGENPVLLRVELKAGHAGASAVTKTIEQQTDTWAFVCDELGLEIKESNQV